MTYTIIRTKKITSKNKKLIFKKIIKPSVIFVMSSEQKVHITCLATEHTQAVKTFQQALQASGSTLHVFGEGVQWKGFITKIEGYTAIAKSFPPDQLIAIVDAYDVLPNTHFTEKELIRRFYMISPGAGKVVVGAESACFMNCYANVKKVTRQYVTNKNYYPNGGFVMGKAGKIHKLYQHMLDEKWNFDDQYGLGYAMLDTDFFLSSVQIVLDYKQELVNNLHVSQGKTLQDMERGLGIRPVVTSEGTEPMFWHFPRVHADKMRRYNKVLRHFNGHIQTEGCPRLKHYLKYTGNPAYLQYFLPAVACAVLIPILLFFVYKKKRCAMEYDNLVTTMSRSSASSLP